MNNWINRNILRYIDKNLFKLYKENGIHSSVFLLDLVEIGKNNSFFRHAIIGETPQMHGRDYFLINQTINKQIIIGDENVFREFTTLHAPSDSITKVGSRNIFMSYSHIPHDAEIGDANKFANSVQLGGFVKILNNCYFGLGSVVKQKIVIGSHVVIGMGSSVSINIPPFSVVIGNPGTITDINARGLRNLGLSNDEIRILKLHILGSSKFENPKIDNPIVLDHWNSFRSKLN
jgi:UDP-N-acetylglucosamine acyltransferase